MDPPESQKDGNQERILPGLGKDGNEASSGMDNTPEQDGTTHTTVERASRRMEGAAREMVTKLARKGKRRGPNRQTLTLGGEKKMEKSLKRRTKRKMNRRQEFQPGGRTG